MPVTPVRYTSRGVDVVVQECGHEGTVRWRDIQPADPDDPHSPLAVACPVCRDVTSWWPPTGGADARAGQLLHLQHRVRVQGEPFATAKATLRALVQGADEPEGAARWVLDDVEAP